jgi:hypothetical protein
MCKHHLSFPRGSPLSYPVLTRSRSKWNSKTLTEKGWRYLTQTSSSKAPLFSLSPCVILLRTCFSFVFERCSLKNWYFLFKIIFLFLKTKKYYFNILNKTILTEIFIKIVDKNDKLGSRVEKNAFVVLEAKSKVKTTGNPTAASYWKWKYITLFPERKYEAVTHHNLIRDWPIMSNAFYILVSFFFFFFNSWDYTRSNCIQKTKKTPVMRGKEFICYLK